MPNKRFILLDANVTAAYYLPRCTKSKLARSRVAALFDSVRSGSSDFFFYLPNFCVAEVFSVFMKYSFSRWNRHVREHGTIDKRVYKRLVDQFEADIHNGRFIYHYELARYHVLAINLVAPIDHYFQISRARRRKRNKNGARSRRADVNPMGTFDHLIIAMGIHLARIHGPENVTVVTGDSRLAMILAKCKTNIPITTRRKLKLDRAESLTGIRFDRSVFPKHVNLVNATTNELIDAFGMWPLPTGNVSGVYRHLVLPPG